MVSAMDRTSMQLARPISCTGLTQFESLLALLLNARATQVQPKSVQKGTQVQLFDLMVRAVNWASMQLARPISCTC